MKNFLLFTSVVFSVNICSCFSFEQKKPNVIIIMTDDQGYQDLSCYGSPLIKTPNIDKMAGEGIKLTDYYVSCSVSSASRAGLMTGKMNNHNGVTGVFWPDEDGLPLEEITLAESLKEQGYATACFGKWHLGDTKKHLPTERGFDEYFGIPYSHDMYIGAGHILSDRIVFREGFNMERTKNAQAFIREHKLKEIKENNLKDLSPLFEGREVVEYPCDHSTLTRRYFDKAIDFIDRNSENPFFIYLTPNLPHTPLAASEDFLNVSDRGLYGDAVEEIDWNVGRLLSYLDKKKLSENTLVVFTSDNGPWLEKGEDGGSALPLRDGKFSQYEGGVRTPCIIRWKGHVPEGVVSESMFENIDWFPTIMSLAGVSKLNHKVDGINQVDFLKNPSLNLRDEYLYVKNGQIRGIRKGDWVYLPYSGNDKRKKNIIPELFNIKKDLEEQENLHSVNVDKVEELKKLLERYK